MQLTFKIPSFNKESNSRMSKLFLGQPLKFKEKLSHIIETRPMEHVTIYSIDMREYSSHNDIY